jgi:hypothetical protein
MWLHAIVMTIATCHNAVQGRLSSAKRRRIAHLDHAPVVLPMRWKVGQLLVLVLAAAIVLAIYQSLWGPAYVNAKIVFGAYLACLATATVAVLFTKPAWRRLWLGYALFGWCWMATVLWHFMGMIPDIYAPNMIANCLLGMALGVLSGLACHNLPGMR